MGIGSFLLLAVGFVVDGVPRLDLSGWGIVSWLAIINTALAFTLWNYTLQSLTAIESTLINNTMLVQIAILAWLFLGEPISVREGVGLILAVLGVLCVQLAGDRSKKPHPADPPEQAQADRHCCSVHAQAEESHLASNNAGEQIAFSSNNQSVEGKVNSRATLRNWLLLAMLQLAGSAVGCTDTPAQQPIPVKVVVVTMCEIGEDEGDRAGVMNLILKVRSGCHYLLPDAGAPGAMLSNDVVEPGSGVGDQR
jgi:multidrug transporter EmrE-like cation transporter